MVLERISRDEMLMEMAFVVAKRGTCSRAQVGCVISRDGRIIVTGYNGAASSMAHCTHDEWTYPSLEKDTTLPHWLKPLFDPEHGSHWDYDPVGTTFYWDGQRISYGANAGGCSIVEHAERNAIAFAARWGTALEGAEIHCTHAPCLACAKSILNAGIKRLTFTIPYRLTEGVELLQQAKLEIVDLSLQK